MEKPHACPHCGEIHSVSLAVLNKHDQPETFSCSNCRREFSVARNIDTRFGTKAAPLLDPSQVLAEGVVLYRVFGKDVSLPNWLRKAALDEMCEKGVPYRWQVIIEQRLLHKKPAGTLAAVGKRFGIGGQRVRMVEGEVCRRLRYIASRLEREATVSDVKIVYNRGQSKYLSALCGVLIVAVSDS